MRHAGAVPPDDDPWRAPVSTDSPTLRSDPPQPAPSDADEWFDASSWAGLFAVGVAHALVAAAVLAMGDAFPLNWPAAFGIFQLTFLVPLVLVLIWRGAPRQAVVGVFAGAAIAFLANGAFIAVVGWDGLGV